MSTVKTASKAKVMIVEDEVIIASDLKVQLEGLGYEVTIAVTTGEEAIKFAESDPPDLVLMDIILSGKMDGIDTADVIRSQYNIPVVFITAPTSQYKSGVPDIFINLGFLNNKQWLLCLHVIRG